MKRLIVFLFLSTIPAFAQFGNATRLQGRNVAPTAPADTNVLCWSASSKAWLPCGSGSGSGVVYCATSADTNTAFACASATLSAYVAGVTLAFVPDVSGAGGATTIAVAALSAQSVKLADGTTNPGASDIVAGRQYTLTYDGTVFRLGPTLTYGNLPVGTTASTVAAGNDARFPVATMFPDQPSWQICNPAGCGAETSNGYYAIMNPNGVTFIECGVNLAIAATGSTVYFDIQDSTGTSIFSAGHIPITVANGTVTQFSTAFTTGTSNYTAAKGAKFRAAITQNDSGGTAQFAYGRCRVQ